MQHINILIKNILYSIDRSWVDDGDAMGAFEWIAFVIRLENSHRTI